MAGRRTRSSRSGAPPSPPRELPNARREAGQRRRQRELAQAAGRTEAGFAAASRAVLDEVLAMISNPADLAELGNRETLEIAMTDKDVDYPFRRLKGLAEGAKNGSSANELVIADDHVFLLDDARRALQAKFSDDDALDPAKRAEMRGVVHVCAAALLGGIASGNSVDDFRTRGASFLRSFEVQNQWVPIVCLPVAVLAFALMEGLDGRVAVVASKQLQCIAALCHGTFPTAMNSSALAEAVAALRSAGELPEGGRVGKASLKGLLAAALCVPTPEAAEKTRTERIHCAKAGFIARGVVADVLLCTDAYSLRVLQGLVDAVEDGRRPDHVFLELLDADITVVELWRARKVLQSIAGVDAQKLAEALRKLATLDASWVVVTLSPENPDVCVAPSLDFGNNVPLVSELEEVIRGATIVDGDAVLRGADAIVALTSGGGGSHAERLRAEGSLERTISGAALLGSLRVRDDDGYATVFGCVAGAGALRSCLDSEFNIDAVRVPLLALALSGRSGAIMPTVAAADAFNEVRQAVLALDPSRSSSKVQVDLIAIAFGAAAPAQRALSMFEGKRLDCALAAGRGALGFVLKRDADVEMLLRDLDLGQHGAFGMMLSRAAQDVDATATELTVEAGVVPLLDPLLYDVRRALGDMGETDRTRCVQMAKALLIRDGGVRWLDSSKSRAVALSGISAACSAVLLVADSADRGLVVAILASLFGVQGRRGESGMLLPSAFKSEEVREAEARLELCGIFPQGFSLQRPRLLIETLVKGKSFEDLIDTFDDLLETKAEEAARAINLLASAEEVLEACGGEASDLEDDESKDENYEYSSDGGDDLTWEERVAQTLRDRFEAITLKVDAYPDAVAPENASASFFRDVDAYELPAPSPRPPPQNLEWEGGSIAAAWARARKFVDPKESTGQSRLASQRSPASAIAGRAPKAKKPDASPPPPPVL